LIEGADASLERAGLKSWDVIMAHRFDVSVPMVEIVKGFNHLINTGKCYYWGTSEWSVQQIQEAIGIANQLGLDPPLADQAQYNAFKRDRVEAEYAPLYKNHDYGLTIWSPLARCVISG
jgi:aryl-alcohol dehydrogenase-like predicted oxidoreductase